MSGLNHDGLIVEGQADPRIAHAIMAMMDELPELADLPEGRAVVLQEKVEVAIKQALSPKGRRMS